MNKTAFLHIPFLIFFFCGCSSPVKEHQPVIAEQSRLISVTGIVKSINSASADTSISSPESMLHFIVKIETYDDGGWDTILGPEAAFVCGEKNLSEQTGKKLEPGERVFITSYITETSPKIIAVHTIKIMQKKPE